MYMNLPRDASCHILTIDVHNIIYFVHKNGLKEHWLVHVPMAKKPFVKAQWHGVADSSDLSAVSDFPLYWRILLLAYMPKSSRVSHRNVTGCDKMSHSKGVPRIDFADFRGARARVNLRSQCTTWQAGRNPNAAPPRLLSLDRCG